MLARQIRQYKAGTQAVVTLWRDGKKLDVPVVFGVSARSRNGTAVVGGCALGIHRAGGGV